jgi:hypothetical protein
VRDNNTDVGDRDAAMAWAGRGIEAATGMRAKLGGLIADIAGLQAGSPWGTSEAGEMFEHIYHTDKGGAQFMIDNTPVVVAAADDAMGFAAFAVSRIGALDEDIRDSLWHVDPDIGSQLAAGEQERDGL